MTAKLLTTQQAANLIGFTDSRLRQLIARGKWLFSLKEIERIRTRRKGKGQ